MHAATVLGAPVVGKLRAERLSALTARLAVKPELAEYINARVPDTSGAEKLVPKLALAPLVV